MLVWHYLFVGQVGDLTLNSFCKLVIGNWIDRYPIDEIDTNISIEPIEKWLKRFFIMYEV